MKAVFVFLTLVSVSAFAEQKKIDLKPEATKGVKKAEDTGSATQLLYKSPKALEAEAKKTKKPGVAVTATCTDNQGMVHKQGDKSYDSCLRTMDKTAPSTPASDKNRPSMGISIGN